MGLHRQTIKIFLEEKRLWIYTVILMCGFVHFSIYQFMWQPQINLLMNDKGVFPLVNSIGLLIIIIVSYVVKKTQVNKGAFLVTVLTLVSFFLLIYGQSFSIILIGILLYRGSKAYKLPIINGYIHEYIPDNIRSSTTSLVSTIASVFLIILQPIIGVALDKKLYWIITIINIVTFLIETICLKIVITNYLVVAKNNEYLVKDGRNIQ